MVTNKKKSLVKIFAIVVMLFSFFTINPTTAFAEGDGHGLGGFNVTVGGDGGFSVAGDGFEDSRDDAWNNFISKYKNFIVGVGAMATVTMLGIFIYMFAKLGASTGNDQARRQAISGILWAGIAAACLGTVTTIVGFFFSAFQGQK